MGGALGCHRSIPRDPADLSCGKRKFSAACNFSNISVNHERLNINAATEEELMTLPGVNRAVAQNIVEYRDCIGGFRKVEDLALVSGIGAAKLEAIKPEICVSSRSSSSQHSPSSLRREPEHPSGTGINVNTATAAQLRSVRGLTEKIVRNIVAYRAEHGPFRSIEDLVKVQHVSSSLLDRIRFQVYVERSRTPSTNTQQSPTSFSLRSEEPDLPPGGPTHIGSVRPSGEPPLALRDGKPVVRLATWSLQSCCCEKANNPGVREVVCMTLLENDIKILAVQDLLEREALDKKVLFLLSCSGSGSGLTAGSVSQGWTFSGFLWDSSSGFDLKDAVVLDGPVTNGNGNQPQLYRACFSLGSMELVLVNVHMPSASSGESKEPGQHLSSSIQETLKGEKELVVLGDFGGPPQSSELDVLRREKLLALVPSGRFTNISTRCPQGSQCLDNIWISRSLKKIYSGHCMVVREGLTNPWIPDNWSWGGVASDHCPVVAEFYADPSSKELSRPTVAVVDRGDGTPKHER
ncbi:PREDICTED: endonuclease/exonuclease/phosphatase family domain-containing protein 1 [Cyprinodon variegatus]|uniref:endonuclease/exonuclease/phosphatase family domain-containing protein 1 n=1 Tax=Cyprinodon variegatus TaxID=28743 RepID=UPI00074274B0|nr:PREDICTED: endonuclease/exonuclease/phosphatase family domain-containing protein 1 [Cyprinodon variegatus]